MENNKKMFDDVLEIAFKIPLRPSERGDHLKNNETDDFSNGQ